MKNQAPPASPIAVNVIVFRRDNAYWLIPSDPTYQGIPIRGAAFARKTYAALDSDFPLDMEMAFLNATPVSLGEAASVVEAVNQAHGMALTAVYPPRATVYRVDGGFSHDGTIRQVVEHETRELKNTLVISDPVLECVGHESARQCKWVCLTWAEAAEYLHDDEEAEADEGDKLEAGESLAGEVESFMLDPLTVIAADRFGGLLVYIP